MSITSDIRSYADSALEQGKHVVGQAQHQINDVTGQANEFVGKLTGTAKDNVSGLTTKASDAVNDLRVQAEKTLNLDAIKTAVEPYLAQAKQYRSSVTDRAEGVFATVKGDKRVAKVVDTAGALSSVVIDTVSERVVKPVSSITGLGSKPAKKKSAARASKTTKPASTRPAAKSTAKKAPAKKATAAKSTARKTAAKKAPATPAQS